MPANITIDYDFISEWHPQYDIMENDDPECRSLVSAVGDDIDRTGTISEDTFFRILDWKAPRVKGKINQAGLGNYLQAIEQAYNAEGDQRTSMLGIRKLSILTTLQGIGPPVGSTIFHFMHPDTFPIFEQRKGQTFNTTEVKDLVTDAYPSIMRGNVIPSAYCSI